MSFTYVAGGFTAAGNTAVGIALGQLLLKITLVLLTALMLDYLLRRRFALTTATMWNATLLLLVGLPLACLLLPEMRFKSGAPEFNSSLAVQLYPIDSGGLPSADHGGATSPTDASVEVRDAPDLTVARTTAAAPAPTANPRPPIHEGWSGIRWFSATLVAIYFLGLATALLRFAASLRQVACLRRTSHEVADADWRRRLIAWQARCGLSQRVELRQSDRVSLPLVFGVRRPVVILPADAVDLTSGAARDAILAHELTHVVRGDFGWQLLLKGVQAMLWFHPLTWLAARRIGFIRERVCDAFTIHCLGNTESYVETLLDLAGRLVRRPAVSLGLAVLRSTHLGERLAAMRTSSRGSPRCQPSRRVRWIAFVSAIALAGWLGRSAIAEPPVPQVPGLPAQAQALVAQFDAEATRVRSEADRQIAAKRAQLGQSLKAMQDQYTRDAKLDEAVAIRDQIRLLRAPARAANVPLLFAGQQLNLPSLRGRSGLTFAVELTGSTTGSVWGTDEYTDDSSLAAAAVHGGALAVDEKGIVQITTLPGKPSYHGSSRNGVASNDWNNSGGYYSGFRVDRLTQAATALTINGITTATPHQAPMALAPGSLAAYRHAVGQSFEFQVRGAPGNAIWGTDVYTDDSALDTAVVHAGLLQPGEVGIVRVTILPDQATYDGSTRNGVTSYSYGSWPGSYRVELVRKQGLITQYQSRSTLRPAAEYPGRAAEFRGRIGEKYAFPVIGSTEGYVWGSDVYTDDSSLGAAAVHAGILQPGERGIVEVTILGGQSAYAGSTRNGVTSTPYGPWQGSFRIERHPPSLDPNQPSNDSQGGTSPVLPDKQPDDPTFIRRRALDLLGELPTPEATTEFVNDPDPDKRSKLIDRLLERSAARDKPSAALRAKLGVWQAFAAQVAGAYQSGQASLYQVLDAKRHVHEVELELCETDQQRITVLEQMLAEAKDYEQATRLQLQAGKASNEAALKAQVERLDVEAALERLWAQDAAEAK